MSSSEEYRGVENELLLLSVYTDSRAFLDRLKSLKSDDPDVFTITFADSDESDRFHRLFVKNASATFQQLLNGKEVPYAKFDSSTQTVIWTHENAKNTTYCKVFRRLLRFCYGEDERFTIEECPVAFAIALQLQFIIPANKKPIHSIILEHVLKIAKKDARIGARLLVDFAVTYEECHGEAAMNADLRLAEIVLKSYNLEKYPDEIIDECLLMLPIKYITVTEFSPFDERLSKAYICQRYYKYHANSLSATDKNMLVNWWTNEPLGSKQMEELSKLNVVSLQTFSQIGVSQLNESESKLQELGKEKDELVESLKRGSFILRELPENTKQWKWVKKETERILPIFDVLKVNLLKLEELDLSDCPLAEDRNPEMAPILKRELASVLKTNTTLTKLNLYSCRIGPSGLKLLCDSLKFNTTLKELNLVYNKLGDESMEFLCELLSVNTTLTSLNLTKNLFYPDGATALSGVLTVNKSLTYLSLDTNRIENKGVVALCEALKSNTTLKSLSLGSTGFEMEGTQALRELLRTNTTLTYLNINDNHSFLTEKEAVVMFEALKTNETLVSLMMKLSCKSIGDTGAKMLREVLSTNTTLKHLDLYCVCINDAQISEICKGLKDNRSLATLNLGSNLISDKGGKSIRDLLKRRSPRTLQVLDLSDNNISSDSVIKDITAAWGVGDGLSLA